MLDDDCAYIIIHRDVVSDREHVIEGDACWCKPLVIAASRVFPQDDDENDGYTPVSAA